MPDEPAHLLSGVVVDPVAGHQHVAEHLPVTRDLSKLVAREVRRGCRARVQLDRQTARGQRRQPADHVHPASLVDSVHPREHLPGARRETPDHPQRRGAANDVSRPQPREQQPVRRPAGKDQEHLNAPEPQQQRGKASDLPPQRHVIQRRHRRSPLSVTSTAPVPRANSQLEG